MTMINAYSAAGAAALDPKERALVERRERVLGPAYRLFYQEPVHIVRAEGVWLYDPQGEAYLDVYNNVASVGHCHPRVVQAIADQAAILNTHTRYLNEGVIAYAERLVALFPPELSQAMFTCTGSEANDLAIRIAKAHTGGEGIVITENAYHGVTQAIAELSPSLGQYVKLGEHVRTVPCDPSDNGARFAAAVSDAFASMPGVKPAALLVDTILSSDGVFPDPGGWLKPAFEAARAAGAVCIADEVQAGFCRTGDAFWGFQRHGLAPDIVTMGKPMGAGHPIAGLVARPEILEAFGRTCRYFNTFGGNPVSCAAGMAVLDVIEDERLLANSADVGAYLKAQIQALNSPRIREVRGAGLFLGVELTGDATEVVNALRQRRVLISATGPDANILKVRPPLVFSREHADLFVAALSEVL